MPDSDVRFAFVPWGPIEDAESVPVPLLYGHVQVFDNGTQIGFTEPNSRDAMMLLPSLTELMDGCLALNRKRTGSVFNFNGIGSSYSLKLSKKPGDRIEISLGNTARTYTTESFAVGIYKGVQELISLLRDHGLEPFKEYESDLESAIASDFTVALGEFMTEFHIGSDSAVFKDW